MSLKIRFNNLLAELSRHEVFVLAASLAYTTGLALAPFVLILLSLASLLGDEQRLKIFESFSMAVGTQAAESIELILENAEKHPKASGVSGTIGFIILLISASAIFSQLRYALNKVNEHKYNELEESWKGFLKDRLFSIGLLLGFIFLFIASLLLSTALGLVFTGGENFLWQSLIFIVNFAIFALLFAAIYRFVPSDKLSWRKCLISGTTSAFFFVVGKTLISLYLGNAAIGSAYGAAGSLVVFLGLL
jgi:membrane protein